MADTMNAPKRSVSKSYLFLIVILMVLMVTAVVMFFVLQTDSIGEMLENDQLIKTLVVLEDDSQVVWTAVLIYYPTYKNAAIFDIQGYTGAIYSSIGRVDRIDAIYREKGIETYLAEIEKLTDTEIPFTLEISLDNFSKLTDMLGGQNVFIPSAVDYIDENTGNHYLLPSGAVNLDGNKIRTYLKYKLPSDSTEDVQDRKENSMIAFLEALNRNKNDFFDAKTYEHYAPLFKSNLEGSSLRKLLSELVNIRTDGLVPQSVLGTSRIVDGKTLVFPYEDGDYLQEAVKRSTTSLLTRDGQMSNRVYVIEVQNGTTTPKLAYNTGNLLKKAGYDVLQSINAATDDLQNTYIIDHIGNASEAKKLADVIHCEIIKTDEVSTSGRLEADSPVDFSVVLGADFNGKYVR